MKTEIFLIRHGQPVLEKALLGTTDSPLSELGCSQMQNSLAMLNHIDLVISSPLRRCAAFGENYSNQNNLPLILEPLLQECHFGDWDGLTYQYLYENHGEALHDFFNEPFHHCPPKGEALIDFNRRVVSIFEKIIEKYQGKRIVIMTHAGVIRTLVSWCLKMDYQSGFQFNRFAIDYASMTQINVFVSNPERPADVSPILFPQLIKLNYV